MIKDTRRSIDKMRGIMYSLSRDMETQAKEAELLIRSTQAELREYQHMITGGVIVDGCAASGMGIMAGRSVLLVQKKGRLVIVMREQTTDTLALECAPEDMIGISMCIEALVEKVLQNMKYQMFI